MSKGTKLMRMGRVNSMVERLKETLEIFEKMSQENNINAEHEAHRYGALFGAKAMLEVVMREFPELNNEEV